MKNSSTLFKQDISKPMLSRIPNYLTYLKSINLEKKYISTSLIAQGLGLGVVQVRKDLASISNEGKPKLGYELEPLIITLESFLGYNKVENTVLIGAGKLGMALYNYEGFEEYGLRIVAIFDTDEYISKNNFPPKVSPLRDLKQICRDNQVKIGIISVPSGAAQEVSDLLVSAKVKGILNFAPGHLIVPKDVTLQNINIATTLALLAKQIKQEKR